MPIKGLTDRDRDFGQGLPCLGRIFKGEPKGENRPGRDLKYFRIAFTPQYEYMAPVWRKVYGDQPTEFKNVYLAGGTPDDAFPTWKEAWRSGAMMRRCNGHEIVRWFDEASQTYRSDPKPCLGKCDCKNSGRLRIFLPDLMLAVSQQLGAENSVLGYFAISTTSVYDILAIHSALSDLYTLKGTVSGIQMRLGRADRKVRGDNGKGQKISSTKSLLYLVVSGTVVAEMIPALGSGSTASVPALPSGIPEPPDEDFIEDDSESAVIDDGLPFDVPPEPEPEGSAVQPGWANAIMEFCENRTENSADEIITAAGKTWDDLNKSNDPVDDFVQMLVDTKAKIWFADDKIQIKSRPSHKAGQNPLAITDSFLGYEVMEPRFIAETDNNKFNAAEIDTAVWTFPGEYDLPCACTYTVVRLPDTARKANPHSLLIGEVARV